MLASIGVSGFGGLASKKKVTGREVFSALLPDDFDYVGVSRSGEPVVIKKGQLVEGIIDTKAIGGEGEGLLLRSLHKQYGPAKTIKILHHILRMGIEYLFIHGFSTGIADEDLPQEARDQIDQLLHQAEEDVSQMIKSFQDGTLEVYPGRTASETLELKILERLNKARNACGQIIKGFVEDKNHAAVMILSGARGSITSLIQMSACVGQQAMRGKRIEKGYRNRTLSCFKRGDLSPESHGFIIHGFKHGINPKEFFFHAITGRDALMDTALRTTKSVYLYRRLANAMQDLRVEYDGTVRDASGRIIQFKYGEDGIDVARSESGKIDVKKIINTTE
jgi:DNA-directed RNA polymerase subunit A'